MLDTGSDVSIAGRLHRALDWSRTPMGASVLALGLSQIIAWGTTLYLLGVLGGPIAEDTGWSRGLVFGGLSAGLLVSGAVSTIVGRAIDRHGGRIVMTAGSVLAAVGLALLASVNSIAAYLAAWLLLGVAMRLTLYDAAFAAAVQAAPSRGRRAISYITLFGGFASTIFWPIGYALQAAFGWRTTVLIFAAINLLVCAPLHWWGLARRESQAAPAEATTNGGSRSPDEPLSGQARVVAMMLFALVMSSNSFVFGAIAVHLPGMLAAGGLSAAAAITLASLKGFAQVGGRVWELAYGQRLAPLTVGRIAVALLPISFLILLSGQASFTMALLFTLVLGVSNGLITIVRGAVPLHLFGPQGYGAVLGLLATPYLIVNALAPTVFALIVDWIGYRLATVVLIGFAVLALVAMEIMAWWYNRRNR